MWPLLSASACLWTWCLMLLIHASSVPELQDQQQHQHVVAYPYPGTEWLEPSGAHGTSLGKQAFIAALLANMTLEDLIQQLHLTFGADIVGPASHNELYNTTMSPTPSSPIGHVHDWYPLNISAYNQLQQLTLASARLKIPLMHFGECLHGVGSFRQSMFPQSLGLAASFDTDLVYRVGRAIATEARSIGIHACFSPVLDLGLDPRWGRMQEGWGEDKILTTHMGVAYAAGLSKNGDWAAPDAVVPVMKHFAAHGSPQGGHNAGPFMGRGTRQVWQELLMPFRAAVQLGGARGVMMAYNEVDDVPAHVHPKLYAALEEWGFDGFVIADDTGMEELYSVHRVAESPADAIRQWYQAGGMLQFYDWSLETLLEATRGLIANGSLALATVQARVQSVLSVKWDLGLFEDPYIAQSVDPVQIVRDHRGLTLEAAQKSIVLLENRNSTLPLRPREQNVSRIAVIGPFADVLNYGDYSGQWGSYPAEGATTIRQGVLSYSHNNKSSFEVVSSWGAADTWEYKAQYVIPPYLLSTPNGTTGGLQVTYFADTTFQEAVVTRTEVPALDWGIYPPAGLSSTNFSAIWEGNLTSPVDKDVQGWIGVAVGANTTVRLFIDNVLVTAWGSPLTASSNILGNIQPLTFIQANSTLPPPGAAPFTFRQGATYSVRIEYQAFTLAKKEANVVSLNSQLLLFWNLVSDNNNNAVELASSADVILLALGAAWNSDGESADRATLSLSASQDRLAQAIYALGKPVVLVLQGGRPFAIPQYYDASAAVLAAWFPGQHGGQAIADVLFGAVDPGGARLPVSVPRDVGQVPVNYNYKSLGRKIRYLDVGSAPCYPFGYGLSYTSFVVEGFTAAADTFTQGDVVEFSVRVVNQGPVEGSHVVQVYLLARVSSLVQPVRQLVAFQRVYLAAGEATTVVLRLDVDRYLTVLNRWDKWELEKGEYTFAVRENGGDDEEEEDGMLMMNVTLKAV